MKYIPRFPITVKWKSGTGFKLAVRKSTSVSSIIAEARSRGFNAKEVWLKGKTLKPSDTLSEVEENDIVEVK